jgi:hypothetical protein
MFLISLLNVAIKLTPVVKFLHVLTMMSTRLCENAVTRINPAQENQTKKSAQFHEVDIMTGMI